VRGSFPLGAAATVGQLEDDPHPLLAELREHEPVSWVPALGGWLVTRHDLVIAAMRDARSFTVDDPRFSTAQVIGPSMLSLDGAEHDRHRAPFVGPFRARTVTERFGAVARARAGELIDDLFPRGRAELRREFAGPLAAGIVAQALGLAAREVPSVLAWYDAIVASVTDITAGRDPGERGSTAFAQLGARLRDAVTLEQSSSLLATAASASTLEPEQVVSNAAVLLFGGIETTEGMIANAVLYLLQAPERLDEVLSEPRLLDAALEESLRLEPAAAVIDRYATVDTQLGGVEIGRGDLVRLSIAAANRDPVVFEEPEDFDLHRSNARRHLAFAQGPHVCVGVHLARLEAQIGLRQLLTRLPHLKLDPSHRASIRGLVFRKPVQLRVMWDSRVRDHAELDATTKESPWP
jgi:cytochrome P450